MWGHAIETSCNKIILIAFLSVWFNTREIHENAVAGNKSTGSVLRRAYPSFVPGNFLLKKSVSTQYIKKNFFKKSEVVT